MMHDDDKAIVRALVPVAWADGTFHAKEREMFDALLDAYGASADERAELHAYAAQKREVADIDVQTLSAEDRRVVLQHAVLLAHVDGDYSADEASMMKDVAKQLRIPDDEATTLIATSSARAARLQTLL